MRKAPPLGPRFDAALKLAVNVHRRDTRKGKSTPYVSHLLGVCSLVLQHGGTEVEAIGALLHDTLEDHPDAVTPALLRKQFGLKVTAIVIACTDTPADYRGGPKPAWRTRKEAYVAHLAKGTRSAQTVALADKLYNLGELLIDLRSDGKKTLKRFNAGPKDQLWYFTSVLSALRKSGYEGPMLDAFAASVSEFRRLVR